MTDKSPIESKLDAEIISALDKLESLRDTQDKYAAQIEHIAKLHKLKSDERLDLHKIDSDTRLNMPSLDNVLVVAANIFGILWLARYERENVIKARSALGFVMKPR